MSRRLSVAIAGLALIGWVCQRPGLTDWGTMVPMMPTTALCIGACAWLFRCRKHDHCAVLLSLVIVLITMFAITDREPAAMQTVRGHMSASAAIVLCLLTIGTWLDVRPHLAWWSLLALPIVIEATIDPRVGTQAMSLPSMVALSGLILSQAIAQYRKHR